MKLRTISSVLAVVLIGTAAVYMFCFRVQIEQVLSVKYLADVPLPVRAMFANDNRQLYSVVRVDGRKIQYVYYGQAFSNYMRMLPLLAVLKANHASLRNRLPNGVYVIALVDGIHQPMFPWPVLTFSSTKSLVKNGFAVLLPDFEALKGYAPMFREISKASHQHPWQSKTAKIFWRGSATGASETTNDLNGFPRASFLYNMQNASYVDAGFVGYPAFINQEFAQRLKAKFGVKRYVSSADSLTYKYLIDLDGQSCSYERMAWILYSNSLLLKHQTDKVQWYYDRMQPGVHYLPIAEDFSNVAQQFAWAQAHPQQVQAMIRNANQLALEVFSKNGVQKATAAAFRSYQRQVAKLSAKPELNFEIKLG